MPLENARATDHGAMPTVPFSITNRFLSGFPLPPRTLRAIRVHEFLRDSHVAGVIALDAQAQLFCLRNESKSLSRQLLRLLAPDR